MPCVSGTAFTLATIVGGGVSLFTQDKYRRIWTALGIMLVAAWVFYFSQMRVLPLRIGLEVFSVLYFVTLTSRLIYWVFWMKRMPWGYEFMRKALSFLKPYLTNPGTVATYCYLVYMFWWDKLGRADFTASDYRIAAAIFVGWLTILTCYRNLVLPRLMKKPAADGEKSALPVNKDRGSAEEGICPLGFDTPREKVHA